ncbi:uncharacterized protein LOC143188330 [Calliopsis andreniformis]|uniref:uncharacterized protein LOC143188330 n=1 Tax=Calliopsis andreniformis TaxID=337506 RepID=UPI003FCD8F14
MLPTVFCILMLAISEPLLTFANKVVVVIPQPIKRSHSPSWRPGVLRFRKSPHANDFHHRKYHAPYYSKKPLYSSAPFPHGGDDFDKGYESVNHVHIPHGKDISHAVSFGKGYIPYDNIKSTLSVDHERYPETQEHKSSESDYTSTSTNSEYPSSGYETSHSETYFPNPESALNYNERRNDIKKLYTSRSIEKDLAANVDLSSILNQGKVPLFLLQQKATELYKVPPPIQGNVVLPSGIPAATIGGSKEGIVLRDTVSLDDYQQKLSEMTRSWPQFGANGGSAVASSFQNQQVISSFPAGQTSSFTGSISWPLSFAQPKQGYAVKEDTMEPPHDFRTMPIQTSPVQTFPLQVNAAITPLLLSDMHGKEGSMRNLALQVCFAAVYGVQALVVIVFRGNFVFGITNNAQWVIKIWLTWKKFRSFRYLAIAIIAKVL